MSAPAAASSEPAVLRKPGTIWLDAARRDADTQRAQGLLFTEPEAILTAHVAAEVIPLLDALDAHVSAGRYVAGMLAYEAGYALEPEVFERGAIPDRGLSELLGWFGVYSAPERTTAVEAEHLLSDAGRFCLEDARFDLDRTTYANRVRRIKESIRSGDTYQVNLTAPVRFALFGDPLGFYRAVRARQRVPYGAFLCLSPYDLCSFSPELFFRIDGRTITARPMKGTTPRGASPAEDDRFAEALLADEKNRAENLMIVDLLRNDLSRVTEPGSVRVPRLFEAERYETVTQLTSTVTATLRPEATLGGVFRALFPCGSVTGAPKLRTMQLIRGLERAPRGAYCGAIGYAGPKSAEPDGPTESQGIEAVFSVPIRTVELAGEEGRLGVGSGIVWDSEAEAEYEECLLKARFMTGMAA